MTEVPPPRANPLLFGHEGVEAELRRLYEEGRLPHAILICGPRGIGKATLAFRLARFVLAGEGSGEGLATPPESGVFHRVAAGGHADLLTVERGFDLRRRRLRNEIVAEEAREIAGFLRLTAAEEGWRVVVVDGAEEMTRSAANALLKILEEPPQRALLLLVSHSPGRLLPTIRSRCRRLALAALSPALVRKLLDRWRPDLAADQRAALAALAEGSIGQAIELAEAGGVALYRSLLDLLREVPRLDAGMLRAFADRLLRPGAEDSFRIVEELLSRLLARLALAAAGCESAPAETAEAIVEGEGNTIARLARRAGAAHWAGLRQEIEASFARAAELNLDRRQALFGAFFAVADAAG
ncbi:MAG TPA: DNA polymerase III subunit delta' [Stellaceae bacterium]|nr:DNA polymerase III subunit delta' [Stellaceae bacterium]